MKTKLNPECAEKRNFLSFKNSGSLKTVKYVAVLTTVIALTQLPPFGGTEGDCQGTYNNI